MEPDVILHPEGVNLESHIFRGVLERVLCQPRKSLDI
jgi:hypothetical protein